MKYDPLEVERLLALRAKARANLEFKDCHLTTLQTGICMPAYDKESADADLRNNVYSLADQLAAAREIVKGQREALEIIAGKRQCVDNLMGNVDVAIQALRLTEESSDE